MKSERQQAILELITRENIETQTELARRLQEMDFEITQATVSRDIKELGLVKTVDEQGRHKYILPMQSAAGRALTRFERVMRDSIVSIDSAGNLLVIKTYPGSAQLVASVLDNSRWEEIMGTIAGDDTLMVIARDEKKIQSLLKKIAQKIR